MQVEYDLTLEDIKAFQRYHAKHPLTPRKRGAWGGLAFGLAGGAVVVLAVLGYHFLRTSLLYPPYSLLSIALYQLLNMAPGVAVGAILALIGFSLFVRLLTVNATRKHLQEGRNAEKALGWRRLSIDPHAIRSTSAFSSNANFWEGIDAVVATGDYVFLYITTRAAHVVPRRAFPDDRAFDQFVEAARRYHQISRLGEGPRRPADEDEERPLPRPAAVPPPLPADFAAEGIVAKAPPAEEAPAPPGEQRGPVP
jgi:YcxB-like protein